MILLSCGTKSDVYMSVDTNILVCIYEHKNRVCMCVGFCVIDRQGGKRQQ